MFQTSEVNNDLQLNGHGFKIPIQNHANLINILFTSDFFGLSICYVNKLVQ